MKTSLHRCAVFVAPRRLVAAAALACAAFSAQSQTFTQAFDAALKNDAAYSAAMVGVLNREIAAKEAESSFYPSAGLSYSLPEVGQGKGVATLSLVQPVASYDRYLNRQQMDPLRAQARVQARQARDELNLRVFKAMADIVRTRETIRALDVQLRGLSEQLQRARRMRELGQGTITEVNDFEVRLAVAQANRVSQETTQQAAVRTLNRITGLSPVVGAVNVADAAGVGPLPVDDENGFVTAVLASSTSVQAARLNVTLQEIAAKRVRAKYVPSLNASVSRGTDGSTSGGVRFGISLDAPLSAGSLYEDQRAANDLVQANDNLRLAEQTTSSDALTLWRAAINQVREVEIRRRAVASAQLALEANIKSYQGGVKSNIDVVTSYQNLADSETALANSELALTETRLQQRLLLAP
jgi:protease secretion system outer membrane protein